MISKGTGLVLEGGGFRGVYTSGVLRFFMDQKIFFPYVIGVSMGACNAANYVARQAERNRIVNIRYVNDARYISYRRLLLRGELFGMGFIFNKIPMELVPFDFETFRNSDVKCLTTVTDCESGEALYFEKRDSGPDYLTLLQASCSLPLLARPVQYKGRILMDGGLTDSVPLDKSVEDGNEKNVLVLTQPKGYRKKPSRFARVIRIRYGSYKGLCEAVATRHIRYNHTMDLVDRMEEKGEIFVIRPHNPINAGRIERNKDKLYVAYDQGYADATSMAEGMFRYLNEK